MAIQWSGWHTTGGNGMRVGVDVSVSTVTSSSTSVTFTYDVYTENAWQYDDLQWLTFSGNQSGTLNYNNTQAQGAIRRTTRQYTYTYPAGSMNTSPGSTTMHVAVGGAYNGSAPGITVTTVIPPRPGSPVQPPTGVTLTRQSDQTWTLTWTPQPTAAAPYTSQAVFIRAYQNNVWSPYYQLATLGPGVSSYSQSNAGPNVIYQAAVQAFGQYSTSARVTSGYVWMTPAAPSNVSVTRNTNGSDVTLYWQNNHYTNAGVVLQVQSRLDGGPWTSVVDDLQGQHAALITTLPGAGLVDYRIRAYQPNQDVASEWVSFPSVGNAFPPLAPTSLAPDGEARDATDPVVFTWRHRTSGDGARQSAYELRWSPDGGVTWTTTGMITGAIDGRHVAPPGTFSNGGAYQWQVRTWGVTSAGPGPWSQSATITTSATPQVTILDPDGVQEQVPLTVSWGYTQPDGSPQARWEARLVAALGSDPTVPNATVETRSGVGPDDRSTTFAYLIEDGSYYRVEVRSQSAAGLWSAWAQSTFVVDLPLPAEPTVGGEYDLCTGTVVLHLGALPPAAGEIAVSSVTLERRIGDGPWVELARGLPAVTTFVDTLPSTVGANTYRVTAYSLAPSWRTTEVTVNGLDGPSSWGAGDGLWVFLSYGEGFTRVLRFRGEPEVSTSTGRTRRAQHFAGRARPVLLAGENTTYVVDVSGSIFYDHACSGGDACRFDSPPRDWEDAGLSSGLVAYRDFHGRRLFGMLSEVKVDHGLLGHGRVSFAVEQVDVTDPWAGAGESVWVEPVPRAAPAPTPVPDPDPDPDPDPEPEPGASVFPWTLPANLA